MKKRINNKILLKYALFVEIISNNLNNMMIMIIHIVNSEYINYNNYNNFFRADFDK